MEIKCQQVQNPNASFWISFRVTVGSRTHSGCHDFANNCVARTARPKNGLSTIVELECKPGLHPEVLKISEVDQLIC